MSYLKKISSLEEIASTQIAINLCQDYGFKEVALCLEKPTLGTFHLRKSSPSVNDPERLSECAKMEEVQSKGNGLLSCVLLKSVHPFLTHKWTVEHWDAAIDEQCQRLTEGFPNSLKPSIHIWINRIALEYLSYYLRQEVLFGFSRYFLIDSLTRDDWTAVGQLDEEKLAERFVKDEQSTVLQRYRIACVYCLHEHIPRLWKLLTQEEKHSISGYDDPVCSQEQNDLVLLWSYYMDGHRDEKVTGRRNYLWFFAIQQAVRDGNRAALKSCWKKLGEHLRQRIVIRLALKSLFKWQHVRKPRSPEGSWKEKLLSNELPCFVSAERYNLPSYYSELLCFFLSEMNGKQQLTFFREAFKNRYCDTVLECFLDWPHQDDFLPTINRLWGIVPKDKYGQCLLTLASKYSGNYYYKFPPSIKENHCYDYQSLLWRLWEETPEDYKQYLFCCKNPNSDKTVIIYSLLPRLLQRSPFQEKDEALFKLFFRDIPQEDRIAMMHSVYGESICSILMQQEMLCFVNWLLEECLPKGEIVSFKKQFIQSYHGRILCLNKLEENHKQFVENLIDWSFKLDTEKKQFKYELIDKDDCLNSFVSLLSEGKFIEIERVINFCLSADELREQFKFHFVHQTCCCLLENCAWKQMDKILAWNFDAKEKIRNFKKGLFVYAEEIQIHYQLVFIKKYWEGIEDFYKWFCLSPEEIKNIKMKTLFAPKVIHDVCLALHTDTLVPVASLLMCLIDEEMVISFKRKVEEECLKQVLEYKKLKECLDRLVVQLFDKFRKETCDKTSREGFVKGEKRSLEMEEEPSSSRKQFKFTV